MPLIDIPDSQTPEEVALIILSYMLFPDDRDTAIEHFVKHWLLADPGLRNAPNSESVTLPASWIKALISGPSLEQLETSKHLRLRRGFTAGAVLLSMYVTSGLGHKVSMNRAIRMVERSKLAEADGRGQLNLYGNRAEITSSWKSMRSVAHLFAAQIVTEAIDMQSFLPRSKDALVEAACLSNGFLRWAGERQIPKLGGGTEPILLKTTSWAVREEHFAPIPPRPVDRVSLPNWMTMAADHYQGR